MLITAFPSFPIYNFLIDTDNNCVLLPQNTTSIVRLLYVHPLLKNDSNPHSPKSGPIQPPSYTHPLNRCTGNHPALSLPPLPYEWNHPTTYLMSTPTSTPLWVDPYPCTSTFKPLYKALPSPFTLTLHIATSPNYILFHPHVPAMLIPNAIDINTPTQ